ncbi:MAG: HD domain-containing protein [Betaproteobacteria bacterium]|nr:HD domain-containing protein [Betaproteobacteria bacterium]
MALTIYGILQLYESQGAAAYGGERVSQLEHALQCAQLAEASGASTELTVACLLHDIGHLLAGAAERPGMDDVHQYVAMPFLRGVLPPAVLDPIRLHVDAKRYLCYLEQDYWSSLSAASRRSLELQGGRFGAEEAKRFINEPHALEAVLLRRFDDQAKEPSRPTPALQHYAPMLHACSLAVPA